jgi:hypothetical protein
MAFSSLDDLGNLAGGRLVGEVKHLSVIRIAVAKLAVRRRTTCDRSCHYTPLPRRETLQGRSPRELPIT